MAYSFSVLVHYHGGEHRGVQTQCSQHDMVSATESHTYTNKATPSDSTTPSGAIFFQTTTVEYTLKVGRARMYKNKLTEEFYKMAKIQSLGLPSEIQATQG